MFGQAGHESPQAGHGDSGREAFAVYPVEISSVLQERVDAFFVVTFATEAAMKIVAYGLVFEKNAYLRSPWNILDFVTALVGIILISFGRTGEQFASLRSIRTLRALRPFRMASRAPGMKVCCVATRR
jgi:hypothetical protein